MKQSLRRINPIIIVGCVFALVAGIATYRYVRTPPKPPAKPPTVGVKPAEVPILAARDIPTNQLITVESLKSGDPKKAEWSLDQKQRLMDLIGKVASRDLRAGEPIKLEDVMAPVATMTGHDFLVPTGLRALTIRTASAIAGEPELARPGDRVDVIILMPDAQMGKRGVTVAQNVPVLSVVESTATSPAASEGSQGGEAQQPAPEAQVSSTAAPPTVVLGVTPRQAEEIAAGQLFGKVRLTIRNPLDLSKIPYFTRRETGGITRLGIGTPGAVSLVRKPPLPKGAISPRIYTLPGAFPGPTVPIQVVRGTEHSLINVPK